ncbi:hypothetical protein YPPY12_3065, partial [Yersinia pestis PY-12]
MRCPVLPQTN